MTKQARRREDGSVRRYIDYGRYSRSTEDWVAHIIAERTASDKATAEALQRRCMVCGLPADMSASRGPTCQDHYDDLSD